MTHTLSPLAGLRAVVVNWRDPWHSLAGGSERYAWEYAKALRAAGVRVEFLTAREQGQRIAEIREGIEIRRGGGPFTFYAHAALRLLQRRRRLDIVIDPECGIPAFSPLFVRRDTAVVLVLHHVHQEQFRTYFPTPLAWIGRTLERVVMPLVYRGRATVAVSESTRREMQTQLGWKGPVGILANGAKDAAEHDGLAEAKDVDRLVVLGRLVPHKRVDLVLQALHALRDERPDLRLDVCGKGPDRPRLEELTERLGLTDRVTFHGYLEEDAKERLLRGAALHVCASDVEGWGQAVIDAAGYGVPTVARDVPGLRDSVRDEITGWLVPDSADLAVVQQRITDQVRTALRELEEPENLALTVKACLAWATAFSWPHMHEQARALVEEELGHVRAGHIHIER
ncbi:MAG TPA: glycosyltransferase family 4 protein [Nocardioides sp.]|nr:glycosyltransferase family 4 protein [Nocardioides sp.]